jgi:hypothetical protein
MSRPNLTQPRSLRGPAADRMVFGLGLVGAVGREHLRHDEALRPDATQTSTAFSVISVNSNPENERQGRR